MTEQWIVRESFRVEDATRVRAQLRSAAKEYNATGEAVTDPQDWLRRVGVWCD